MGTSNVIEGRFREKAARPAGQSTPSSTPPKGEVVDLDSQRPHVVGLARCMACRHEWVEVTPLDSEFLECPNCTLIHGRFVYGLEPPDGIVFVCDCENDLFNFTPDGLFCLCCGKTHADYAWSPGPKPAA